MVSWIKNDDYKSITLSLIAFAVAALFHGPMIIGAIILMIFIFTIYLKKLFKSLINLHINLKNLTIFLLCITIIGLYVSNKISIPYLGTFENSISIDFLFEKMINASKGDASWPEWTIAKSGIEMLYKAPVRSIYFVFSPFPWDITKPAHFLGFLDSLLYYYLVFLILRNLKVIWRDPALRIILIILLSYIFVFGFGVGNFGTALRHKSKFASMFILLAAPLIKRLILKKNVF